MLTAADDAVARSGGRNGRNDDAGGLISQPEGSLLVVPSVCRGRPLVMTTSTGEKLGVDEMPALWYIRRSDDKINRGDLIGPD